jgi:hypothetical protein
MSMQLWVPVTATTGNVAGKNVDFSTAVRLPSEKQVHLHKQQKHQAACHIHVFSIAPSHRAKVQTCIS